ncbi:structural maintenance of chromosomes protein 1-like [Cornus florida]|uniref:structural maintenance of chromosomes protein 1-like n=1 Tax=Cornus florida TaxID=4283 RepID=UPI00289E1BD5|nr:structural maintenance of chromosomes protein 1-like [Cornus florida]
MEVDRSKLKEVETDQESEGSSEEMIESPRSVAKVRRLNNCSNFEYAEAERTIVLERKRKKEQKEEAEKHLCLQKQRIVSKNPRLLTALLEQISGSDELKREYGELVEQKAGGEEKSTPVYETERTIVLERKWKKEQKEEAGKHICLQKQRGNVKSIVSKNPRLLTALLEQISGSDELKREYGDLEEQKSRAEEKSAPLYQKERTILLERKRKKQLIGVVQSQNAFGNRFPMAHCTRFAIPLLLLLPRRVAATILNQPHLLLPQNVMNLPNLVPSGMQLMGMKSWDGAAQMVHGKKIVYFHICRLHCNILDNI